MFEIPRRGRQARNFECSENSRSQIVFQIDIFRKLALGAPGCVECLIKQWFYQKKLRMQKWAVFHLISKHLLNIYSLCTFFMNYWWVWEVWSRCKWTVRFFVRKGIPSKGLFTWRWGTPGRWGNLLRWGKKITPLYMQSYRPAIPGCTFSRLLNGR